jgi:hypothetical protein
LISSHSSTISSPRRVGALERALQRSEPAVRDAARKALQRIAPAHPRVE